MKVALVAVTKNRSPEEILRLPPQIKILGENKIQEAQKKFMELDQKSDRKFEKHFIGHLQSNKIAKALEIFDVIQSVDSLELLEKINQHAKMTGRSIQIMLQINISKDPGKHGLSEDEAEIIARKIVEYSHIKLIGLMTILKNNLTDSEILSDYQRMNLLFQRLNKHILKKKPLQFLSMGMSDDYELAIKAGANMIRIGKSLFDPHHAEKIYSLV